MECGICYSYQLGDAIPDIICENSHCNQPFHHSCLYEVCTHDICKYPTQDKKKITNLNPVNHILVLILIV